MQKSNPKKAIHPPQKQNRPGYDVRMKPEPAFDTEKPGSAKLEGKVALITGGDSGIGKAVAVLFAKEGADIIIVYLKEHEDAEATKAIIEKKYKRRCILIPTDISKEQNCIRAVDKGLKKFGRINILVNNAGLHYETTGLEEISTVNLIKTFSTNIFPMFWLARHLIPKMVSGDAIINTSSVTAYRGSGGLIDYASTKGAIVSFTRSLSANLASKGIRVNSVAPGPVWTPLIVSSFDSAKIAVFGSDVPMKRAAQPAEIAPSYLFLASDDSIFMTGQCLHPNGGEIVNG